MKQILSTLMGILCLVATNAQDQQRRERIQSSYMLALGKAPSEGEISYWQGRKDANTVADFVKNHRDYLSKDAGTHKATIVKAYVDALGRNPSQAEINYWMQGNDPYFQLMKNHISFLSNNPAEYENVIKRSYQFVLNRQPAAAEIDYWKKQGTFSYVLLVGCHEDWKRKSGATAAKTSGTGTIAANSSFVSLVSISSAVATEVKSFSGLVAAGGGNLVAAGGGNLVAAGGGNLVAAGGGNLVAAGGGN